MEIRVREGDVTQVKADALLTAVNSLGLWFGGVDTAIGSVASKQYHDQAFRALSNDHSVKVVVAPRQYMHTGLFGSVVFVIDDIDEPLKDVVRRGLDAAAGADYHSVSMPAIRMGAMEERSGTQLEKIRAIIDAIREHAKESTKPLDVVTIVIYNDADQARAFNHELA